MNHPAVSITERIAFAFIGGFVGSLYGLLVFMFAFAFTHEAHGNLILISIMTFSFVSLFYGNFAIEGFVAFIAFTFGLLIGLSERDLPKEAQQEKSPFSAILASGFCIGLSISIWWLFD